MTVWQATAYQLLAVFALARILEVVSSRMRELVARDRRGVRPAREPWYKLIVLVHAAVFVGSAATVAVRAEMPPAPVVFGALGVLCFAFLIRAWMFWTLRGRWNVRVLDPGTIATNGPYRFIRHPNYLAVILEVAALPLAVGAYEVALLGSIANAVVLSWRIPFEERTLAAAHPVYRDVMMRRPRFVPRMGATSRHSTRPVTP